MGDQREERDTERVKSRCPERRAGVERRVWRKKLEKKKLKDYEIEQEIKRERRGREGRHGEKVSETEENRHT